MFDPLQSGLDSRLAPGLALIFDMDGVMVNSNGIHRETWTLFNRRFGLETTEAMLHFMYGRRNDEIVRGFFGQDLPAAEETLAEFVPGYEVPVQLLPAGAGWRGAGGPVADGSTIPQIREMETIALVPQAADGTPEVEEGRGDHVRATDGDVGQFHALPRSKQKL